MSIEMGECAMRTDNYLSVVERFPNFTPARHSAAWARSLHKKVWVGA